MEVGGEQLNETQHLGGLGEQAARMELGQERLAQLLYVTGYRSALKGLRLGGLFLLAVGTIPFLSCIPSSQGLTARMLFGLLIGALLVAVGLQNIIAPSVQGIAAHGAAACLLGVFFGACALPWLIEGGIGEWIAGVCLTAPFFVWGVFALTQYRKQRQRFPVPPLGEAVAFTKQLISAVFRSQIAQCEQAVEFRAQDTSLAAAIGAQCLGPVGELAAAARKRWRGLLLADAAVFVSASRELLAGMREEVSIVTQRSVSRRTACKALLRVGAAELPITIPLESFRRYRAWKGHHVTSPWPEDPGRPAPDDPQTDPAEYGGDRLSGEGR